MGLMDRLNNAGQAALSTVSGQATDEQARSIGSPEASGLPMAMLDNIVRRNDAVVALADKLELANEDNANNPSLEDILIMQGRPPTPGSKNYRLKTNEIDNLLKKAKANELNARAKYVGSSGRGRDELMRRLETIDRLQGNPDFQLLVKDTEFGRQLAEESVALRKEAGFTGIVKKNSPASKKEKEYKTEAEIIDDYEAGVFGDKKSKAAQASAQAAKAKLSKK